MPTEIANTTHAFNAITALRANPSLNAGELKGWVQAANARYRRALTLGVSSEAAKGDAKRAADDWVKVERAKGAKASEGIEPTGLGCVIVEGVTYQREQLAEYVTSRGIKPVVDRTRGVIEGVKILGLVSKNGRTYSPAAVREAKARYEGAKVNVNHPPANQPHLARGYEDRLGALRGVTLVEGKGPEVDGLYGNLHFNPKHALAEQLAWDAENSPENVGFSHNIIGQSRPTKTGPVVERIEVVNSVDLVADPATTRGLFESVIPKGADRMDLKDITLEQLRSERPELLEALIADAADKSEAKASADKIAALESLIAKMNGEKATAERADKLRALLTEAKLPDPSTDEGKAVFGDAVLEMLSSAAVEKLPAIVESLAKLRGEVKESNGGTAPKSASGMNGGGGSTSAATLEGFISAVRKPL